MIKSKDIISTNINKEDLGNLDITDEHLEDVLYYAEILDKKGYEYDLEYNHLKRVSMIIKNNPAISGHIFIGKNNDWGKMIKLIDESLLNKFDEKDIWIQYHGIEITGELPTMKELLS